jgi:vancomycin resistance protein YoaR
MKMKKKLINISLFLLGFALVAGVLAAAHYVANLPEAEFVKKISVPQLSFEEFETFDEAVNQLQLLEQEFFVSPITWTSERGNITKTPNEMGATASLGEIEDYLYNFYTETTELERVIVYLFGKMLSNELSIDTTQLKAAFEGTEIEQGSKSASYSYSGGNVQIEEEQIGYGIDETKIATSLIGFWQEEFNSPDETELPLQTSEPEIRQATLEELLPHAQVASALSFELMDEWGSTWDLNMWEHVEWLLPAEEEAELVFQLNQDGVEAFLAQDILETINRESEPVVITEAEDGTISFEGSARFGKNVNVPELARELETALASLESMQISIPIDTIMPEVTVPESLASRGITDLLEYGYTNFVGSPYNRIYNVNHGMEIYNGIIIPKDGEFSFTTLLGPVDGAHGWLEELVILGDETKPEYGGGLCQVSSTMYRAALYSGLNITARKEHSYAVSYYAYPNGYGLDATIYQPYPDLRFINDTPADILVQGYTEGTYAFFVFYGTNDGRSVQMEGPQYHSYVSPPPAETTYTDQLEPGVRQLESHSHTGFQVDWFRTIFYGDGTQSERENIHTYYEARPEKWLEGKSEEVLEEEEN